MLFRLVGSKKSKLNAAKPIHEVAREKWRER
jgi:hypothetical protein